MFASADEKNMTKVAAQAPDPRIFAANTLVIAVPCAVVLWAKAAAGRARAAVDSHRAGRNIAKHSSLPRLDPVA